MSEFDPEVHSAKAPGASALRRSGHLPVSKKTKELTSELRALRTYEAPPLGRRKTPNRAVLDRSLHYLRHHWEDECENQVFPQPAGLAEHLDLPLETLNAWLDRAEKEKCQKCMEFRDIFLRMQAKAERFVTHESIQGMTGLSFANLYVQHQFGYRSKQHVVTENETKVKVEKAPITKEEAAEGYRDLMQGGNVVPLRKA